MELSRIPLKKVGPSKKYTPREQIDVHLNTAKVKYGRLNPKTLKSIVAREPVTDFSDDIGYYGPATLGGQQFQFLFDTGSSDLWVPKVGYNNGASTTHNTFNQKKSSTFKTENEPFSITYGKGSTSGIAASDTFSFAGFTINNQAFGLADTVSADFDSSPFDGILGMALESLSELKSPTPFQNLVSDGDVSSSVFSFLLGREKDGSSSELILGGLDPNFSKNISYNKLINKRGFWQIALDGAQVDGNAVELSSTDAVIDTGTTLLIVPVKDADAIFAQIPGYTVQDGMYLIPSDTKSVVSLTFGGVTYDINAEDLAFGDAGNGQSVSGIQGENMPGMETTWLVGDTFLKNVFSAFDLGKLNVGFAPITK